MKFGMAVFFWGGRITYFDDKPIEMEDNSFLF